MEINSVSLSGQGQLYGHSTSDMASGPALTIWPCACCLMLCGHRLDILNNFYFGFIFCNEVRWDSKACPGDLQPWLTWGPTCYCLPTSLKDPGLPLLLPPLPPFASSGNWARGPGELDQPVVPVLSVRDRRGHL